MAVRHFGHQRLDPRQQPALDAERLGDHPAERAVDAAAAGAVGERVVAQRAVVVEDAVSGVRAGRAGGFGLVVGVARGEDPEVLLGSGADLVARDLTDLDLV